jgi:hypothetical protein
MDLSTWPQDLGLENYAEAYCANDIDTEVLARLMAKDLIAPGIPSIGHRRKLSTPLLRSTNEGLRLP